MVQSLDLKRCFMKKVSAAVLIAVLALACCGCESKKTQAEETTSYEYMTGSSAETLTTVETEAVETDSSVHIVDTSIDDGFSEGDYHGTLVIEKDGNYYSADTYYTDISGDGAGAQQIVDNEESAAYFKYDNYHVYADHDNTGFSILSTIEVGDEAWLYERSEDEDPADILLEKYKCVRVCPGYNYGHIFDENMTDISDLNDGTILMYTCSGQYTIYMTFWEVAED